MTEVTNAPKLVYVPRPELPETYVEFVEAARSENGIVKFEFAVARIGADATAQAGQRIPVARLVMNVPAFLNLLENVNQMAAALQKNGVLQVTGAPNPPI